MYSISIAIITSLNRVSLAVLFIHINYMQIPILYSMIFMQTHTGNYYYSIMYYTHIT